MKTLKQAVHTYVGHLIWNNLSEQDYAWRVWKQHKITLLNQTWDNSSLKERWEKIKQQNFLMFWRKPFCFIKKYFCFRCFASFASFFDITNFWDFLTTLEIFSYEFSFGFRQKYFHEISSSSDRPSSNLRELPKILPDYLFTTAAMKPQVLLIFILFTIESSAASRIHLKSLSIRHLRKNDFGLIFGEK